MAAARGDWERVDALLQDKSEDVDLDYTITVRTHMHTHDMLQSMTPRLYMYM